MSTPAGVGVLALLDLPDPCVLGEGDVVAAYGLALRLLTAPGAMELVGDPYPYASIDLRQSVGSRFPTGGARALEQQARDVLNQDERAASVDCSIVLSGGALVATVHAQGAAGPFGFVLSVDAVGAATLRSF